MKIPGRARPSRTDVDMVPMINFVFLLLVFFLLVGRLAPLDVLRVTPPASSGADPEDRGGDALLVTADGRLALHGETFGEDALASRASAWRAAHPDAILAVKADSALPATRAIALLEALRGAGIVEVRLLTVPARR